MRKFRRLLFCLITCVVCISCATGHFTLKNWGQIVPDDTVRAQFENYQVNPNLTYYISGSDVYPNAILGLNKEYKLVSSLWKEIEMTPQVLQTKVFDMKLKALNMGQDQFGFVVLDNRGKQIGVWYSLLTATAPVQMKEDKKVIIYTPDIDVYENHQENSPNKPNVPVR